MRQVVHNYKFIRFAPPEEAYAWGFKQTDDGTWWAWRAEENHTEARGFATAQAAQAWASGVAA